MAAAFRRDVSFTLVISCCLFVDTVWTVELVLMFCIHFLQYLSREPRDVSHSARGLQNGRVVLCGDVMYACVSSVSVALTILAVDLHFFGAHIFSFSMVPLHCFLTCLCLRCCGELLVLVLLALLAVFSTWCFSLLRHSPV